MKICRFDDDRLGIVEGGHIIDVTEALRELPAVRWPIAPGDLLISQLDSVRKRMQSLSATARRVAVEDATLKSPVANPSKIIGAPVNYREHADEAKGAAINHGHEVKPIEEWGLFLKANSALVGPGEGVRQRFSDRRNDHEVELAAIIGKPGNNITASKALEHVAGYAIGLDMTVRGPQFQSFRKSIDTYAVLGPWLVTADEFGSPDDVDFSLSVNGELRQSSNTRMMIMNTARLIEFASSYYSLHPGDIIMTGTPAGVGPVKPGDVMLASFDRIGSMRVRVAGA